MKLVKWLAVIVVVLILALAAFWAYLGGFSTLKVVEQKMGPYVLVYEDFVGPYQNAGKVVMKVYSSLAKDGIVATKGFGIYLDDPKTTSADKMRSQLGCVLEEKDWPRIRELSKKFKTANWAVKNSMVIEFPLKNNFSYMVGAMKVYPVLMKYLGEKKYMITAPMELYDMPGKKIYFIMEIVK